MYNNNNNFTKISKTIEIMIKQLFLSILFSTLILCTPNKIILNDNLYPTIDKISHSTTSFGLYYTFRYFGHGEGKSILLSSGVGVAYEIYQIYDPFEEEHFRGISLHDIFYNIIGISSAYIIDKIITRSQKKQKSFERVMS